MTKLERLLLAVNTVGVLACLYYIFDLYVLSSVIGNSMTYLADVLGQVAKMGGVFSF